MSNPFLEERLPQEVRMGALYSDDYNVEIIKTASKAEHRRLIDPYPQREATIHYTQKTDDLWNKVVSLFHRAFGMFAGFRVRNMDDFSTNDHTGAPTAFDMPMALISSGVYQLQKQYGIGGTPLPIGFPVRTIFKPVAGTVLVGVSGVAIAASGWSVDVTTGLVTFSANKTATITGITKAASAVISCAGHAFTSGESVYLSGVAGMTQINGQRAVISSVVAGTSITVPINSTAYSTYTSGGMTNTRPQPGESVTAGCEFDLPCRFNSRIDITHVSYNVRETGSIDIIELVNP